MARTRAKVTQADLARAIRAARQAGAGAVELMSDGTIRIPVVPTSAQEISAATLEPESEAVL